MTLRSVSGLDNLAYGNDVILRDEEILVLLTYRYLARDLAGLLLSQHIFSPKRGPSSWSSHPWLTSPMVSMLPFLCQRSIITHAVSNKLKGATHLFVTHRRRLIDLAAKALEREINRRA